MAKAPLQMEIEGLKELQAKAIQMVAEMHGPDIAKASRDSTILLLQRAAKPPPGGYGNRKNRGGGAGYVRSKVPVGYIPVDTSKLRDSLTPFVDVHGPVVQGGVGTNVVYGPYQEFGTRRGVRALKYLQTALKEKRAEIEAKFGHAIDAIVKRRPK